MGGGGCSRMTELSPAVQAPFLLMQAAAALMARDSTHGAPPAAFVGHRDSCVGHHNSTFVRS